MINHAQVLAPEQVLKEEQQEGQQGPNPQKELINQ